MSVNRQWLLKERPKGMLSEEHFEYRETEIPTILDGEVLVKTSTLGFDPMQRGLVMDRESYIPPVGLGEVMKGSAAGQVVESKNDNFKVGDIVQGFGGWQDYFVSGADSPMPVSKLPQGVTPEMALGVLGVTGLTAYIGILELGAPKAGDTVLVSGAAGATGSVAGQIAKLEGCRVVGIAGGAEKCAWLTEQAGFDTAIDYKNEDVAAKVREHCPDGLDVYFDNVGGEILQAALNNLAMNARVVLCGGISGYNEEVPPPGPNNLMNLIGTRSTMEGYIIIDYLDRMPEFQKAMGQWLQEGKVVHLDDIQEGFENIPATLMRLFTGKNMGKQMLKIAGD